MQEQSVVTVFLRNRSDVLLLRRSDEVGSYRGKWGPVAGHAEGDPDAAAETEIREETGIDPAGQTTLRRRGDPFDVPDEYLGIRWTVHPYLFDCHTRRVTTDEESDAWQWVRPPEILRLETVPELWTSYDRVRPTFDAIEADHERGASDLSLRALEVLRDEAAVAAHRETADWEAIRRIALELVDARPAMPAIATRVDRLMHDTDPGRPTDVMTDAEAAITRVLRCDSDTARAAADVVEAARVATLSRSGTVRRTLERGEPAAVLVAESRPGGEGVGFASELADRLSAPVALTSDAAFASRLETWDADVVLVGADAISPDGDIYNKVGTRAAAAAGAHEGLELVAVAATAKVTLDPSLPDEPRPEAELTEDPSVAVDNPTFEWTPAALVDRIVTERGVLETGEVADLAADVRQWRAWRRS